MVRQETSYPWDGRVVMRVSVDQPTTFGLRLRLPGWGRAATVRVNGTDVDLARRVVDGYVRLERQWSPGDRVELDVPMPVERVYAHPAVRQDVGCVALQRGPFVYCLEEADNAVALHRIVLPKHEPLAAIRRSDLLTGIVTITASARVATNSHDDDALYRTYRPPLAAFPMTAIPYYAWDHRQPGQMRVWIHDKDDGGGTPLSGSGS